MLKNKTKKLHVLDIDMLGFFNVGFFIFCILLCFDYIREKLFALHLIIANCKVWINHTMYVIGRQCVISVLRPDDWLRDSKNSARGN